MACGDAEIERSVTENVAATGSAPAQVMSAVCKER